MFGFNPDKMSVKCQLCTKRMSLVRNKKMLQVRYAAGFCLRSMQFQSHYLLNMLLHLQIDALKYEVAEMMKKKQDVNARIRVEEVIRQEWLVQAYATLETYILLLQTRAGMLKKCKDPPPDMREAINTILFAAERVKFDLDEMPAIADMLMSKFKSSLCQIYEAKDFPLLITQEHAAIELQVNETVVAALSTSPAPAAEKYSKLEEIAEEKGVNFNKEAMQRELLPRAPRVPPPTSTFKPPPSGSGGGGGAYVYVGQQAASRPAAAVPAPVHQPQYQPEPPIQTEVYMKPLPRPAQQAQQPAPLKFATFHDEPVALPPPVYTQPAAPAAPFVPMTQAPAAPDSSVTRPTGPIRLMSNKSPDPWAPLPPMKTNLGYGFDNKLDSVAYYIGKRRSGSVHDDGASMRSGEGSQDLSGIDLAPSPHATAGPLQNGITSVPEEELFLPSPPKGMPSPQTAAAPPAAPAPAAAAQPVEPPAEAPSTEESLVERLARLRGL